MNDRQSLISSIIKEAQKYPEGATHFNIFRETVNHFVIDRFVGLAKRMGDKAPTSKNLADTVKSTAAEVYTLNPTLISKEQYTDYIAALKQHPEVTEYLRPIYEKAIQFSK